MPKHGKSMPVNRQPRNLFVNRIVRLNRRNMRRFPTEKVNAISFSRGRR
ncbi:hypothetical protein [Thaumasiovibrio subtropicus]|nr:hypothetical protein [Thaumasiovibrio subtropicus]